MVKIYALHKVENAKETAMAAPGENLKINPDRLWDSLMEMAQIGPGVAGGNNRQTLTDEDAEGRALFQKWCEEAGCTMGLDTMGNMFAQRDGTDPDALPVYVGSHLDTQPTGGKYDGVLGVLGGLELLRTMNDLGIKTKHPVVVTNWTNEEGTRYAPAMLSSGVFAGIHTQEWAYAKTDAEGLSFGDELKRIGWQGDEEVGARKMHAFFELHIEQGPILETEGKDIGVVTHGQGLSWTQVTVTGKDAHTGSTPMPMRKNAGLGMARMLEAVDQIAWSHAPHAVGAAGHFEVYPNSRNVIPGQVIFTPGNDIGPFGVDIFVAHQILADLLDDLALDQHIRFPGPIRRADHAALDNLAHLFSPLSVFQMVQIPGVWGLPPRARPLRPPTGSAHNLCRFQHRMQQNIGTRFGPVFGDLFGLVMA